MNIYKITYFNKSSEPPTNYSTIVMTHPNAQEAYNTFVNDNPNCNMIDIFKIEEMTS